jgi:hypothetical protein
MGSINICSFSRISQIGIFSRRKLFIVIVFFWFTFSLKANVDSINCYIQIQDIWDLDYNKSTVKLDFFIILEYNNKDSLGFTLLNGTILNREIQFSDSVSDHKFYIERIQSENRIKFDFDRFPLDSQYIEIILEPNSYADKQIFYSNSAQNIFVGETHLNGWNTKHINFSSRKVTYLIKERFGNKKYQYELANFSIPLYRKNPILYFFKTFITTLISILIIYFGFLLPPKMIEPRLNLSVGSLFVMISNLIVTQQLLPDVSAISLIEKLNIGSLVLISVTILYFALVFKYHTRVKPVNWSNINYIFIAISLSIYIAFCVFVTL